MSTIRVQQKCTKMVDLSLIYSRKADVFIETQSSSNPLITVRPKGHHAKSKSNVRRVMQWLDAGLGGFTTNE